MTNEAKINIEINDQDVDNLVGSLVSLSQSLQVLQDSFTQTKRKADQAEDSFDDFGDAADRAERKSDGLDSGMGKLGASIRGAGLAAGAAIVAVAGLDSAQAALQTTIDGVRRSFEVLLERNSRLNEEFNFTGNLADTTRASFAELVFELVGGEEALEDLNFVLTETNEALGNLADESDAAQSPVIGLAISAIQSAQALSQASLQLTNLYNLLVAGTVIVEAPFAAMARLAQVVNDVDVEAEGAADRFGVLGQKLDRMTGRLGRAENRVQTFQEIFDELSRSIQNGTEETINQAEANEFLIETYGTLGELLTGQQGLREPRPRGGGGGARINTEAIEAAQNLEELREAAQEFRQEIAQLYQESKLTEEQFEEATGISFGAMMGRITSLEIANAEELIEAFGLDALKEQLAAFGRNIARSVNEAEAEVGRAARLMIKHQENIFDVPFMNIHKEYSRLLRGTVDNFDTVVGFAEALGASEERIASINERREETLSRINREYRTSIDMAEAAGQALKNMYEPMRFDISELRLSGLGRTLAGELRQLQRIDPVIESVHELREAFDALPERVARVAREAGMSFTEIVKAVDEANNALRATFAEDAFKGFQDLFIRLGRTIGDAIGAGLDEGESAGDRAKKFLAQLLGDFLQTIGSTAIAQGAIVAFGDPLTGGLPNPGRAAGLIAAGTAAVVAGAALSGAASKIGGQQAPNDTTPASFGAGGGGGTGEASITNIFVENRFGNRFDARELDRAAADSFARAASAGQA